MKKLTNRGIITASIIAIASVVIFSGCKKDGTNLNVHKNAANIRTFATIDDLFKEVDLINQMDETHLQAYEQSLNFLSFGRQMDDLYQSLIDDLGITNQLKEGFDVNDVGDSASIVGSIKSYVTGYSQYFQIEEDNGELYFTSLLEDNFFRYVINQDQMVVVDNRLWKILENGIVDAPLDTVIPNIVLPNDPGGNTSNNGGYYYQILLGITDENVTSVIGQYPSINYTPYNGKTQKSNYGRYISDRIENISKKERLEYFFGIEDGSTPAGEFVHRFVVLQAKAQKRCCWIWWNVQRTIGVDLSAWVNIGGNNLAVRETRSQYKFLYSLEYHHANYFILPDPYIVSAVGSVWISFVTINIYKP